MAGLTALFVVLISSRIHLCEHVGSEQRAYVGESVTLECHPMLSSPVLWVFTPNGKNAELDVCIDDHVSKEFRERYSLYKTADGYHNLQITEVDVIDGGKYTCIEDRGLSERHTDVHLVVLEKPTAEESLTTQTTSEETSFYATAVTNSCEQPTTGDNVWKILCLVTWALIVALELPLGIIRIKKCWTMWRDHQYRMEKRTGLIIDRNLRMLSAGLPDTEGWMEGCYLDEITKPRCVQIINRLPIEVMEMLLMRSYFLLVYMHLELNTTKKYAATRSYLTLASTTSWWWQTLTGWPHSYTRHWLKHKIRRSIHKLYVAYPLIHPRIITTFRTFKEVTGVAYLNNCVYVVCSNSDAVELFSLDQSREQFSIIIQTLTQPVDIVASCDSNALYVADAAILQPCIWKLDTTGKVEKFIGLSENYFETPATSPPFNNISSGENSPTNYVPSSFQFGLTGESIPISLSIQSRQLLVTTSRRLLKFSPDGHMLEVLNLPGNIRALHAVETRRRTVVVCHHTTVECELSEIDRDRNILRSFSFENTFGYPQHLAIDDFDRIIVSDNTNGKILLLSSELKFPLSLVNLTNDVTRTRLRFDQASGLLVIGEGKSRSAKIFSLRKSKFIWNRLYQQ